MKTSAALLTFAFLLGTSAQALAAATPEEAQRLTALFQSYLGVRTGRGDGRARGRVLCRHLDLAPVFAKIKEPGASASIDAH